MFPYKSNKDQFCAKLVDLDDILISIYIVTIFKNSLEPQKFIYMLFDFQIPIEIFQTTSDADIINYLVHNAI